jgi:acetoin:2,6-dichlorophenolindophenol oxidoreductase subunit alpha
MIPASEAVLTTTTIIPSWAKRSTMAQPNPLTDPATTPTLLPAGPFSSNRSELLLESYDSAAPLVVGLCYGPFHGLFSRRTKGCRAGSRSMTVTSQEETTPTAAQQRRMYELMSLMKAMDDRMFRGVSSGEFIANYFPFRGQEAIPAAMGVVLRDGDQLVTTYRGIHDHIGKGVPLDQILAEVLGKRTALSRGKGGLMHIASPENGSMLSTGIVGAGIPVAVGLALAAQLERSDRVTAVTFGDGATNTGSFHEAANMAALWNLPIVLICQNNLFAEKTPTDRTMKVKRISDRAVAYDIPGVSVDGNDANKVYGALVAAVNRARTGGGPSLIECVTFRLRGHSMGDDMRYVPKDQLAEAETRDPIPAYRRTLLADGVCDEDELAEIETAAAASVDAAVKQVLSEPDPSPDELTSDVYANADHMPA